MSNLPVLSARAKKALDVLADGGRFAQRLERNTYTGREQFEYRLTRGRAWSDVVKGIGFSAFYELKEKGLLEYCPGEGTSVSTYYKLRADGN